jgi:hypothetical protein
VRAECRFRHGQSNAFDENGSVRRRLQVDRGFLCKRRACSVGVGGRRQMRGNPAGWGHAATLCSLLLPLIVVFPAGLLSYSGIRTHTRISEKPTRLQILTDSPAAPITHLLPASPHAQQHPTGHLSINRGTAMVVPW